MNMPLLSFKTCILSQNVQHAAVLPLLMPLFCVVWNATSMYISRVSYHQLLSIRFTRTPSPSWIVLLKMIFQYISTVMFARKKEIICNVFATGQHATLW